MEVNILVRYGELSVKGKNKRRFIRQLADNIREHLYDVKPLTVRGEFDFLFITAEEAAKELILERLADVFGIQSYGVVYKLPRNLDALAQKAQALVAEELEKSAPRTFKIATSRADHSYEHDTYALNSFLGSVIGKAFPNLTVQMEEPDLTLRLKVRQQDFILNTNFIPGRGGLPVGSSAKGALMLSVGFDSPVAGYLAMKRGIRPLAIHFASPPYTSPQATENARDLAQTLTRYSNWLPFTVVPFTEIQEEIKAKVPSEYLMTVTRRLMMRVSDALCAKHEALAIINGESIGQVASQTLESMACINAVTRTPVIRPVVTMDKLEIIALAQDIGTHDLSQAPYEDCCTIFAPPQPKTKPRLKEVEKFEEALDIEGLVARTVAACEVEILRWQAAPQKDTFSELL